MNPIHSLCFGKEARTFSPYVSEVRGHQHNVYAMVFDGKLKMLQQNLANFFFLCLSHLINSSNTQKRAGHRAQNVYLVKLTG